MLSRINQRRSGVILSYLAQAIQILSGLIYTPIMLRILGQSEYGLYQLVFSVVSYLSLLSLGFSTAYMRFYSRAKAADDDDEICRLNGMFLSIFLVMAVICLLCGVIMVGKIEMIFAEGLTPEEYPKARVLMSLMVINLAMTFPNSVFEGFTTAHERFFFQKMLIVLQSLLNPFITLPLLLLGYGSVAMVCITTLLTLARLIVNVVYSHRNLHIRFIFNDFRFGLLKEMWAFTFFIFLNQIVDQVNWNVGKFLLGRFVGTTSVAIFGLGAQINTMYLQFSTAVSNVFVPKVNRIVATTNDNDELTSVFTKVGRVQFMIMALILSGFIFFGKPFMLLWGGAGYENSYYVTLLLIIPVTVPLIQNLGVEIQRAKNMHRTRSIAYIIMAVFNILISIPLIQWSSEIGAAMGTCISFVLGNVLFMNWFYHARIGLNMIVFWKSIARIIPALLIPCIAGLGITTVFVIDSIWTLAAWCVIYTCVYCVSMFCIGMNAEEKRMVSGLIRKSRR